MPAAPVRPVGDDADIVVRDNPGAHRFELLVADRVAGFVTYRRTHASTYAFDHAEVEPAYQGRGLADRLVRRALEEARSRGWAVLPRCPYVRAWLGRHPEHADLVPAAERGGPVS